MASRQLSTAAIFLADSAANLRLRFLLCVHIHTPLLTRVSSALGFQLPSPPARDDGPWRATASPCLNVFPRTMKKATAAGEWRPAPKHLSLTTGQPLPFRLRPCSRRSPPLPTGGVLISWRSDFLH